MNTPKPQYGSRGVRCKATGKRRFPSEHHAKDYSKGSEWKTQRAYYCKSCKHWHLTRQGVENFGKKTKEQHEANKEKKEAARLMALLGDLDISIPDD